MKSMQGESQIPQNASKPFRLHSLFNVGHFRLTEKMATSDERGFHEASGLKSSGSELRKVGFI